MLFKNSAARQFNCISAAISGIYGTADCAEMLIFKANEKLGMRFFEPGGREFESLRAPQFVHCFPIWAAPSMLK